MAPKRSIPSTKPDPGPLNNPTAVTKRKRYAPVRRFENGLLDVERKSGKYSKICKENARSPLLRLPPEIRNQIWELALGGSDFFLDYDLDKVKVVKPETPRTSTPATALLRTCRQIYAEAALCHYKVNAFHFSTLTNAATSQSQSLPQFGVSMIRNLHVNLWPWYIIGLVDTNFMLIHTDRLLAQLPQLRHMVFELFVPCEKLHAPLKKLVAPDGELARDLKKLLKEWHKDFKAVVDFKLVV
ncbi:hypothetical protein T440DRAFT_518049 [Plenodomus tracheiphilus IPT5]|uniref:DUF7730 domain-containing protein n=1 Tax=Plenodomus tracheiphilus IPT5 TaxID=1408161 RepID=A0A6A7B8Q1_9PLEO|nr:hypothetical protein T440DRAFT_518049 [Plenodomus tracheiphilus IPT5]